MGKTPGQQPQAPLPRVRASPYGESCSPVRMSLPHMPPQPSVFDRPNKIPPPIERKRVSNPPSQAAEPVVKCGYGSADERSPGKTTDTVRDSADCVGVCNERHATE